MTAEEKSRFADLVTRLMRPWREDVDEVLLEVWLRAMADVPLSAFDHAIDIYHRTQTYKPTPAQLREILGANQSGWPQPDEAWNMLPKSEDESGWLCEEMAKGYSACEDSLKRGDHFSARRAFIEVYTREVRLAQTMGAKPRWWISEAISGTFESRLQQRQALLEQHPEKRPSLIGPTRQALQTISGLQRTAGGLRQLSADQSASGLTS